MITNHTISDILQQEDLFPKTPLVFHEGIFGVDTVDKLILEIDEVGTNEKFGERLKKKVFNIGVEVIQNLYHHFEKTSIPTEYSEGLFTMFDEDNVLYLMSGNFLKNTQIASVTSRIAMINELSPGELKSLYRGVLDIASVADRGGAGLGFIDIARKSGNQLDYNFITIDKTYSFFVLKIKING